VKEMYAPSQVKEMYAPSQEHLSYTGEIDSKPTPDRSTDYITPDDQYFASLEYIWIGLIGVTRVVCYVYKTKGC